MKVIGIINDNRVTGIEYGLIDIETPVVQQRATKHYKQAAQKKYIKAAKVMKNLRQK